ncbi:MAG: hypothetical protein ACE5MG_11830 [Candidatus Methylomirabilales bacterium]
MAILVAGLLDLLRRLAVHRDFSGEREGPCLVSVFLVIAPEIDSAQSEPGSIIHAPSQQIGFSQVGHPEGTVRHVLHGHQ